MAERMEPEAASLIARLGREYNENCVLANSVDPEGLFQLLVAAVPLPGLEARIGRPPSLNEKAEYWLGRWGGTVRFGEICAVLERFFAQNPSIEPAPPFEITLYRPTLPPDVAIAVVPDLPTTEDRLAAAQECVRVRASIAPNLALAHSLMGSAPAAANVLSRYVVAAQLRNRGYFAVQSPDRRPQDGSPAVVAYATIYPFFVVENGSIEPLFRVEMSASFTPENDALRALYTDPLAASQGALAPSAMARYVQRLLLGGQLLAMRGHLDPHESTALCALVQNSDFFAWHGLDQWRGVMAQNPDVGVAMARLGDENLP